VALERSSSSVLRRLGVKDSKMLSSARRSDLYEKILAVSSTVVSVMIQPEEIDTYVRTGKKYQKLNFLEALYFARVADRLGARKVIVDAPDTSPGRFRENILANIRGKCGIVAAHEADRDFAVVSAASIVAKVERDRAVEKLKRELGDFGSGYPSDPKTRSFFLEKMRKGRPSLPHLRRSWKTWSRLRILQQQESAGSKD
jgi:ribonuclease HII